MEYHDINSRRDAAIFERKVNCLHDGFIVSVNYSHEGYTWGNPMSVDPQKTSLVLRVMVTSINNALVELLFEGVREFQIKENGYELVDSSVSFSEAGLVTWCGDNSTEPDTSRDVSFVIAERMKWRFIS